MQLINNQNKTMLVFIDKSTTKTQLTNSIIPWSPLKKGIYYFLFLLYFLGSKGCCCDLLRLPLDLSLENFIYWFNFILNSI